MSASADDWRHQAACLNYEPDLFHPVGNTVGAQVQAEEAKAAGADVVGAEDLVEKVNSGQIDFDRRPFYVSREWHEERPRIHLQEGDVLIVQTGDVGKVAVEIGRASCRERV